MLELVKWLLTIMNSEQGKGEALTFVMSSCCACSKHIGSLWSVSLNTCRISMMLCEVTVLEEEQSVIVVAEALIKSADRLAGPHGRRLPNHNWIRLCIATAATTYNPQPQPTT